MPKVAVIYDACILYSAPLRDLFMRLALADLYQAKWTEDIHQEWIRSLLKKRPDLGRERLEKIKEKMNMHVRDCLVVGYNDFVKNIVLPDPHDRHVVAAAICAKAKIIVTMNLTDFPFQAIKEYGVEAQHPDKFLCELLNNAPFRVMQVIRETRLSLKRPSKSAEEYLDILERQMLLQTVTYLRDYVDFI